MYVCMYVCVRVMCCYLGPVVRIRRALNKLRQECSDMEVQIGIVSSLMILANGGTNSIQYRLVSVPCLALFLHIPQAEHGLLEAKMKDKTNMKTQMVATTSRQSVANTMF